MSNLTPNAINQIIRVGDPPEGFYPTLQIISVRPIQATAAQGERYRVVISDGVYFAQGMLAKQLVHFIHSGSITEFSVVRVMQFMTNMVSNKNVVILLNLELVNNPGFKIGNPVAATDAPGVNAGMNQQQLPNVIPMYNDVPPPQQQPPQQNIYSKPTAPLQQQNPYAQHNSTAFPARQPGGPIERSNPAEANITPISALNPYANRWTIKARVTNKSEIRTWSNAKGEGSLFSVDLLDSSGCDIRATFFKEAVEKFYHMLELNQVYTFSGGKLKTANMQYNTCKSGLEISMDQNAEIHLVGNDSSIQQQQFDVTKIANLEAIEPNAYVDILGIVKSASPVSTIMSKKTQKELLKSELTVVDDSGAQVSVTMWGDRAKTAQNDFANQPLVGFKKLRVSDFGGRSLSVSGGPLIINPNVPEANAIRHWWETQGAHGQIRSMSGGIGGAGREVPFDERKPISAINHEQLGFSEKPDFLTFKATINFIKRDKDGGPWYTACANPEPPCKNLCKVTSTAENSWYCDRCHQTRQDCVRRYIFNGTVIDDTCTTWVSFFNDQAVQLLGEENSADIVHKRYFDDAEAGFDGIFVKATFSDWIFKCKVKQETVGDENRIKASIVDMRPVDHVKESKYLLSAIAKMS